MSWGECLYAQSEQLSPAQSVIGLGYLTPLFEFSARTRNSTIVAVSLDVRLLYGQTAEIQLYCVKKKTEEWK